MSIKDSGKRQQLPGMVRDTTDDKIDYTLVLDGPLFDRLARHLTEGAKKYSKRNWLGAHTKEEYDRFRESFLRHAMQYLRGDTDEDHFAAVAFNLNGMEYVRQQLASVKPAEADESASDRRIGLEDRRKCLDPKKALEMGYRREGPDSRRKADDPAARPYSVCGGNES